MTATAAGADPAKFDPCTGTPLDSAAAYKGISKVKPSTSQPLKIKPYSGFVSGLSAVGSRLNPMGWWQECCLPMPAQRQFVVGPRVTFARMTGEVRRGLPAAGTPPSLVKFDEHLGLSAGRQPVWSIEAYYQFQPRWGIKYSFMPLSMDGSTIPETSFTFSGQTFSAGTPIRSKLERYEHRAGLVFDLARSTNSVTSLFADWLYTQDKLTVGSAGAAVTSVTWDVNRSLAVLGLELAKCLKNYRGSTLAFNLKGGVAFLDHTIGYEGEAALNYLIPVKQGRFGFIKGGYRYASLKRETNVSLFATTMDGAFVEVGFLF